SSRVRTRAWAAARERAPHLELTDRESGCGGEAEDAHGVGDDLEDARLRGGAEVGAVHGVVWGLARARGVRLRDGGLHGRRARGLRDEVREVAEHDGALVLPIEARVVVVDRRLR